MLTKLAVFFIVTMSSVISLASENLSGLEESKNFQTRRESSADPDWKNGNADNRGLAPGQTLTLANIEGPGKITHIWMTSLNNNNMYMPKLFKLRIYWDGEKNPSVECPVGDFFGVGHGLNVPFVSLPIKVSKGMGRNCYWPMPFRKSARITVTNESDWNSILYYMVDWEKHTSIADDIPYFHAMYRQEYPCATGKDYKNYLFADIVGRGHYVGTVQSVQLALPGWYGEGDDFFYVDGEKEPSIRGTGTEDYFNDAWGFHQQEGLYTGVTVWEGGHIGDRGTAYRFHIPDPIAFQKSLRAEIEHKGSPGYTGGRDDLMSSVAFWYQTEPHKSWPEVRKGDQLFTFRDIPIVPAEKAAEIASHSNGNVEIKEYKSFEKSTKFLMFTPEDEEAWIEIPFTVDNASTIPLMVKLLRNKNSGLWKILVDEKPVGQVNGHYGDNFWGNFTPLGKNSLSKGKHTLRFECQGKDKKSKGYQLSFIALVARTPIR